MSPRERAQRTGSVNVRLRPEEVQYLAEQAETMEISLSEAVRSAIARSYLMDREAGKTRVESWIHPDDATLLDVDED
jgi:hypothetical protein